MERYVEILRYWFGDLTSGKLVPQERLSMWFGKDSSVDRYIKEHFEQDLIQAKEGKLQHWESTPEGYLVSILVLDQFSRHVYRGTPEAYTQDRQALRLCLKGLQKGLDQHLNIVQRVFFYLPMGHSEDIQIQQKCMDYFTFLAKKADSTEVEFVDRALDYAIKHYEVVERFGRFPSRNSILGRESSTEENDFLNEPGIEF